MTHTERALKFWSLYAHNPQVPKEMFVGAMAELLYITEQETLLRVEKAGCAHACAPPCPFHRKMRSFAQTQKDDKA